MTLSKKAQLLIDHLTAIGGGAISEISIRAALGISHGSFISARRELVKCGLIECTHRGGNLPPIYAINVPKPIAKSARASRSAPTPLKKADFSPREQPLMQTLPPMPTVTGSFSSFDDWADALMNALGDCIDITQSLVGDQEYTVFSHAHGQQTLYHITQNDTELDITAVN